jgi:hypothetical protein
MTDGLGGAATTDARVDAPHGLGGPPDDPADLPAGGQGVYEPPWRDARARIARAWARGGPGKRVVLALAGLLAAGLLGAFLFGLWHVVVGGFLKGNWNAGGFGIALASVAGVLLWIEASIARRLLPSAGSS